MGIWLALLAGCILPLIIPIFFDKSREERGRLAGMLFGGYVSLLGAAGAALVIYIAIAHGTAGIGRYGQKAWFAFSEEPIAATLVLLVILACTGTFTAFGWFLFKSSRDRTLGP
jgi:O-antigen ligase